MIKIEQFISTFSFHEEERRHQASKQFLKIIQPNHSIKPFHPASQMNSFYIKCNTGLNRLTGVSMSQDKYIVSIITFQGILEPYEELFFSFTNINLPP